MFAGAYMSCLSLSNKGRKCLPDYTIVVSLSVLIITHFMKVIDNYRTTRVQFENIIIDITLLNKLHGLMNNIYVLPNGPTLILIG